MHERNCLEKRSESLRGNREEGPASKWTEGRATKVLLNLSRKDKTLVSCKDSGKSETVALLLCLTFPFRGNVAIPMALFLLLATVLSRWNMQKWNARGESISKGNRNFKPITSHYFQRILCLYAIHVCYWPYDASGKMFPSRTVRPRNKSDSRTVEKIPI